MEYELPSPEAMRWVDPEHLRRVAAQEEQPELARRAKEEMQRRGLK
jgi:hypothetical protein